REAGGSQGQRGDLQADGRGGQLYSDAAAAGGQAVPDADRGHFLDHGAGDGGHGARGTGDREGGRGSGDRGDPRHAQDGGGGGGGGGEDVREGGGGGAGGEKHRRPVGGDGKGRGGGGQGAGKAGEDQAAQEVKGGGVRPDEGRGGAAHAVLQRVPAAVLFSDD